MQNWTFSISRKAFSTVISTKSKSGWTVFKGDVDSEFREKSNFFNCEHNSELLLKVDCI